MKVRSTQVASLVSLVFILTAIINPVATQSEEFEWQVKVGTRKVYTYTQVYANENFDGDNDSSTSISYYYNDNGTLANFSVNKGTRLIVEILGLETQSISNPTAILNLTFDGVSIRGRYTDYIRPTYPNKTYWENEYDGLEIYSGLNLKDYDYSVNEEEYTETVGYQAGEEKWWFNRTRNWKTGWLTYRKYRISNATVILSEFELRANLPHGIRGYEGIPLLVGLCVLVIARSKRKRLT